MKPKTHPLPIYIEAAIEASIKSPCQKSKRGVVIFNESGMLAYGWNHRPDNHCTGSDSCRKFCNQLCVHAEQDAIIKVNKNNFENSQMLHIKTVDGNAVPSGPPSCWQCSRIILDVGIKAMWLLEDDGWNKYDANSFHEITLKNCGIKT